MTPPDPPPSPPRGLGARWRQVQRLPLTLILTSLLAGLGIVQLTFQLGNLGYRTASWTRETHQTQARIRDLERDLRLLRDAEREAQDPAYLEVLARCQGFVGENEEVVVAPGAPETPGEICVTQRLP
ncbi:cell division protein FtsB [Deinococcus apachensis]|uniref:cell division protein FtsB n=1 Tax=Deinococcus apachensis TaxID=309886 RepID=UPI001FE214C5|nr:cell division protein FtsB [Deinococcus apachensis]